MHEIDLNKKDLRTDLILEKQYKNLESKTTKYKDIEIITTKYKNNNYKIGVVTSNDKRISQRFITGKILHLDGDRKYSEKSYQYYRKLGLDAVVKNIPEYKQSKVVYELLNKYKIPYSYLICEDGAKIFNNVDYCLDTINLDKETIEKTIPILENMNADYYLDDGYNKTTNTSDCVKIVVNCTDAEEKQKIYDQSSKAVQRDLAWNNSDDSKHVVGKGDKLDNIIKDYLTKHLDKFPALKKSVDGDKDKKKWTKDRINEALNDYVKDFREDIAKDLGLESASKIKQGDVLDLRKIKWDEHQPNWFNYNLYY